jgi:hypothetical protein
VDGKPWVKKGGEPFDIGMEYFDSAEVCEIVGLFLIKELSELGIEQGIYRDDGLCVTDLAPREVEKYKKKMSEIFRKYKLDITIEANKKKDIYLDLQKGENDSFRKPEDNPTYVSKESNHPLKVLEIIPKGVNKCLRRISNLPQTIRMHWKEVGIISNYQPEENTNESSVPKRNRCRKIRYFNTPFSKDVKTNVGKQCLQAMDKHFPKGNTLHKIVNRNNVNISYRCTAILGGENCSTRFQTFEKWRQSG